MKTTKMVAFLVLVLGLAIGLVSTAQAEPKYVIFLIGDGMGFEQVKAGGMYANGQTGTLSFESFPYNGELTTYAADSPITDSAAAATALATGVKVNYGVISMAYPGDGSELETLLEYYKAQGKSTGLVTTTWWFHATPAAFGAHESSRNNYGGIANDYWQQTLPNIVFGGYYDEGVAAVSASVGYTVVTDRAAMQALDTETETMVFGQFGIDHLPYEYDGLGSLPHLSEMTTTALSILDNDPDGFFLMVEGGRIDHACHSNDLQRAVLETVEFDNTVQVAIDWAAGRTDTLILVCADHETGGLTVLANNGAGVLPTVQWGTGNHTAANVPVYVWGVNAEMISGVMDNTDLFRVVTGDPQAWNPDPQDGGTGVWLSPVLSWKPGIYAASHQVYFGTVFDDVNNATGASPQADATYVPAGPLEVSTTYYWRIDEVNDLDPNRPCKGDIWSFTTAPGYATQPDPANNAVGVALDATVSWSPGPTATTHDMYFGTSSPPAFVYNQAESSFDPGPLESSTTYYWQINCIEADGTTTYTGDLWSFKTSRPGTGTILREVWENIGSGSAVSDLTGNANYPANPSYSEEVTSFEAPTDFADNFGSRFHGWLHPETSGDYTFWIAADDNCELWLSTDDSSANAVKIAGHTGWTNSREWNTFPEQQSDPISLTGGQKYYIMALYKEGVGGDNMAVAWEGPDSPTRAVIEGYYLSPFVAFWAWAPEPADGATNVTTRTTILSWTPGRNTTSVNGHELYFSSDVNAVNDRTADKVVLSDPSYTITTKLDLGKTYYWCVDEVDADGTTKYKGNVWSFTTATAGR